MWYNFSSRELARIDKLNFPKDIRLLLKERVLVLDGAMGTRIQEANLKAEDFGGHALEGCNENLVLTRPDLIQKIHEDYFAAGADIVESNS